VSPANKAEPIEMPFGLRTWVCPGNHVLDGSPDPLMGRGNFEEGKGRPRPIVKYRNTEVICAKTAELIVILFGFLAQTGQRNDE